VGLEKINPSEFRFGALLSQNDLIQIGKTYRRVLRDFIPGEGAPNYYVNRELLKLSIAQPYQPDTEYQYGDLVTLSNQLKVCEVEQTQSLDDFANVSTTVGFSRGVYPELTVFNPPDPLIPGSYLVSLDTLNISPSSTPTEAILSGLVATTATPLGVLTNNRQYNRGTYIPIRVEQGIQIFLVQSGFKYLVNRDSVSSLISEGKIQAIKVYQFPDGGVISSEYYSARFKLGEIIRYEDELFYCQRETTRASDLIPLPESVVPQPEEITQYYSLLKGSYVAYQESIYLVNQPFTPIYDIAVYVEEGYLSSTDDDIYTVQGDYVEWVDVAAPHEDYIIKDGILYRVMESFSPEGLEDLTTYCEPVLLKYQGEDVIIEDESRTLVATISEVLLDSLAVREATL
jgi:hypothetical protein